MKYALLLIAILIASESYAYGTCIRDFRTGQILYCP
jgi:hypothetical protein